MGGCWRLQRTATRHMVRGGGESLVYNLPGCLMRAEHWTGEMTAWRNTDTALLDADTSCHLLPLLLAKLPPQVSQVFIPWLRGSAASCSTHTCVLLLLGWRIMQSCGCLFALDVSRVWRRGGWQYHIISANLGLIMLAGRYLDNSAQCLRIEQLKFQKVIS